MTLLMCGQENRMKVEEMMLALIQKLVVNKRIDDIAQIKDDMQYRQKLYKEYGIGVLIEFITQIYAKI